MKKLLLAVTVTAIMSVYLSCDKSSSLLIGKWNWVNPYPSNYASSNGRMTMEFTSSSFSIVYSYSDKYSSYQRYAYGTYEYNKSAGTLTLYPTEGDYWGNYTMSAKYYTVQTLNQNSLILVYIKNGSISEYTR